MLLPQHDGLIFVYQQSALMPQLPFKKEGLDIPETTSEGASLATLKNWRSPSRAQRMRAYACVRVSVCVCVHISACVQARLLVCLAAPQMLQWCA
jgi:hypothetical protein